MDNDVLQKVNEFLNTLPPDDGMLPEMPQGDPLEQPRGHQEGPREEEPRLCETIESMDVLEQQERRLFIGTPEMTIKESATIVKLGKAPILDFTQLIKKPLSNDFHTIVIGRTRRTAMSTSLNPKSQPVRAGLVPEAKELLQLQHLIPGPATPTSEEDLMAGLHTNSILTANITARRKTLTQMYQYPFYPIARRTSFLHSSSRIA
ncbi:hypothetical protein MMC30_003884 [Trapelia coarctata]|nr:hypothetical protein [Trapelia coarctata]